jgi:hypothetical protein
MKIRVVGKRGIEAITLTEPLTINRSPDGMNSIRTATGMDHFFACDGTYDGWGMAVSIPVEGIPEDGSIPKEAQSFIDAIEREREVEE